MLNTYTYGYHQNGNITERIENNVHDQFENDELNRIEIPSLFNETYDYDTRGNRQTLQSDQLTRIRKLVYNSI